MSLTRIIKKKKKKHINYIRGRVLKVICKASPDPFWRRFQSNSLKKEKKNFVKKKLKNNINV